jgi:hypothetical protein
MVLGTRKPIFIGLGGRSKALARPYSLFRGIHRLASDRKIANAKKIAKANTPYVENLKN